MFEERCPNLETYGMDISRKESLEKGNVFSIHVVSRPQYRKFLGTGLAMNSPVMTSLVETPLLGDLFINDPLMEKQIFHHGPATCFN